MGIPSYFKRLIQTKKTILLREIPSKVDALAIDFNCIVYTCLRSSELPPYPGSENEELHRAWEAKLLQEVCGTLKEIYESAGGPQKMYIAVDGVVPMAKIRQQRMRRFKSVWWAGKEVEMGVRRSGEARWDTNAITPGTAFMDSLTYRVGGYCKERGWEFSSANEHGEGEHKLLRWLRANEAVQNSIIFGLDADLILLSMLYSKLQSKNVWLMREKTEFQDAGASCKYMFLDIKLLLTGLGCEEYLLDYVVGMSLLGNDFLPHGLTLKIRDNGHERLLSELHTLHANKLRLVEDGTINLDSLKVIIRSLSASEEDDMKKAIKKKTQMRPMAPRTDAEKQMLPIQGLPLEWNAEQRFGTSERLLETWKDIYRVETPKNACSSYLYGLQWILDYYLGKKVVSCWYFHWSVPPLLSDFYDYLDTCRISRYSPPTDVELQPQEQLALVLPMESWNLVRDSTLRGLPSLLPQFWPSSFGFLSLGRSWMWECEAEIPILTPGRMKSVLAV
jgi:5'-3' exoribonuclease 4